jgi:hypothetical protein
MLGGTAVALLVCFGIGAYIFLVTIQHIENDESGVQAYQPPTSREAMVTIATTLRERTQLLTSLRNSPPAAPSLGAVLSEEESGSPSALGDEVEEVVDGQAVSE